MELYRKELKLAVIKGLDESRGSSNVPIKLTHDTSDEYINYTEQIHIRYLFDNQLKEEILPTNDNGFYIPGKPLSHDGPIELAVHLINGDIELVTNELSFVVKNAPNGTTQVDPSEFTWQQLVDQYVNAKLDTFANKLDLSKFEETVNGSIENQNQNIESFKTEVNANLSNQDKKITDLQNTTKVSLDSQNTKIDNFKSEVNTSLSNQNTSINQTTSAQNSKITTLESRMDTFTRLSEGSTTGDAELKDIRVGANGVTYNNAGDAVRGQYSQLKEDLDHYKTYIIKDKELNSTNNTYTIEHLIKKNYVGDITFSFEYLDTLDTNDGWVNIQFKDVSGNNVYDNSFLMSTSNNRYTETVDLHSKDITSIKVTTVNNRTINVNVYFSYVDDIKKIELIDRRTIIESFSGTINNYITSDGVYAHNVGSNKAYEFHTDNIDSFYYSGNTTGYWTSVFGYYADGTNIELLSAGKYINKFIRIPENIVRIGAWSSDNTLNVTYNSLAKSIKETKSVPKNTIIVDSNGYGDFTDIESAVSYARNNFDVEKNPVTIFIKNGDYTVHPNVFSVENQCYCAINKGFNKISIIGESKDGVKIKCYNTSTESGIIMDIGGE